MGAPRLRRARVFIMEGLFPQSLTDKIFYNRAFRSVLSTLAVSVRGGTLNDYWNGADDELFYYAKLNIPAETDDDGYVLLAHAEYLTFIPYGEEGYRFFDGYIREKEGVSAAEWRYNVFLKALGKDREAYGEAQLARLRRFLAGHELNEVRWDDIDGVAAAFFRARHNAEASFPPGFVFNGFFDVWPDIFSELSDLLPERQTMTVEEVLAAAPVPPPLGEKEKAFIIASAQKLEELTA